MSFLPSKTNARKYCVLCFVISTFFIACQPAQQQLIINKYLNANNLKTQFATINIHRDTTLKLAGGTEVIIPKDAIKADHDTLRLTFKEALTPIDILLAGLFTQSNGKALQSDGMIYIAPAAGASAASIVLPIRVKIPSKNADDRMQLFKGEEADKGINWVDPKPAAIKRDSSFDIGKSLFTANCASCHNPAEDATGPALYNAQRHWKDKEAMYDFVRHAAELIAKYGTNGSDGNDYIACLAHNWQVIKPSYPNLTDQQLDAIFSYVQKEGKQKKGTDAEIEGYDYKLCEELQLKAAEMKLAYEEQRDKRQNFAALKDFIRTKVAANANDQMGAGQMISKNNEAADFYNVSIDAFGWYNIDGFSENDPGFKQCELSVVLNRPENVKADLFLFVPSVKMSGLGGLLAGDKERYGFFLLNGKAPLPVGANAYIIAVGESRERAQLYCAIKPFVITDKQEFTLDMQPTDSTTMLQRMRALQLENVTFDVKVDSAGVKSHALEKEVDSLVQQMEQHCDCFQQQDPVRTEGSQTNESVK